MSTADSTMIHYDHAMRPSWRWGRGGGTYMCMYSINSPYGHLCIMVKRTLGSVPLVSVLKRFDCMSLNWIPKSIVLHIEEVAMSLYVLFLLHVQYNLFLYGHLYNTDTSLLRTVHLVPEMPKNHTFPTSIIRTPM